jgi:hypothetical protein
MILLVMQCSPKELGYIFLSLLEGSIKGILVATLSRHRREAQATDVLQRSARRIRTTEACASASFVTLLKVKARIFSKTALGNFIEATVRRASSKFYITLKLIHTNF